MPKPFTLPNDLLLGCATAATQIEGGDTSHNWYDWCERGHIKDGTSCLHADDHYRLYKEDIALMKEMGLEIYRMGVEFSRIMPEQDRFDQDAIAHYKDELRLLRENGIRVLVTLHHFSNPMWFEKMGAFAHPGCVDIFVRYVRYVVEQLGDLCCEYVTINEPNVYAVNGYLFGEWPPGEKSLTKTLKIMKNMARAHIAAYKAIHEVRTACGFAGDTKVGFANNLRVFVPKRSASPIDRFAAKLFDRAYQAANTDAMVWGKFSFPLGLFGRKKGMYCDYFGINYYTRSATQGFRDTTLADVAVNDLGWELYPEGLGILCSRFYARYGLPVWVTENGTCDGKDRFRTRYIYDHLKVLSETDAPVERYYHWTLMDNFEWVEGLSARFGLVQVDYDTQKRTIRQSGRFYCAVIRNKAVTEKMCGEFLPEAVSVTDNTGADTNR